MLSIFAGVENIVDGVVDIKGSIDIIFSSIKADCIIVKLRLMNIIERVRAVLSQTIAQQTPTSNTIFIYLRTSPSINHYLRFLRTFIVYESLTNYEHFLRALLNKETRDRRLHEHLCSRTRGTVEKGKHEMY